MEEDGDDVAVLSVGGVWSAYCEVIAKHIKSAIGSFFLFEGEVKRKKKMQLTREREEMDNT